jgi:hypothetical protein
MNTIVSKLLKKSSKILNIIDMTTSKEELKATCKELKATCKELGIKGYSSKNKSELIEMIRNCLKNESTESTLRKDTEYNGMELIVTLLFMFPSISNKEKLFEIMEDEKSYESIHFNNTNDLSQYKKDIYAKRSLINKYIQNFRQQIIHTQYQIYFFYHLTKI